MTEPAHYGSEPSSHHPRTRAPINQDHKDCSDDQDNPNVQRLWRHRRWMAWTGMGFSAFSWAAGMVLSAYNPELAPGSIHPLVTAGIWAGLIPMSAYVGNCAVSELSKIRGAR